MLRGVVLTSVVAVTIAMTVASTSVAAARPNVVVILADDLGFSDLGCHGGEVDTPNLDRLAAGGLRYTQGYNTARCWPTRAALLTGYYAQAIRRDGMPGLQGGAKGARPAWARLLPALLAPAGYRSYHSGKWHVDGDPRTEGFVRSLDVNATGQSNYFDPRGVVGEPQPRADADFYATTAIGDHAVDCLADHARDHGTAPFFLYVAFTAPHFPLQAPPELIAKERARYQVGWDAIREARIARVEKFGIVTTTAAAIEREVGPPYGFPDAVKRLGPGEVTRPVEWRSLTAEQQAFQAEKMAIHAAMIAAMDREVGRIMAQLEAMRVFDDTLVLFLSDNGASAEIMVRGEGHDPSAPPGSRETFLCLGPGWSSACNAPFRRHKTWVHEGGIATPWIVHWPRGVVGRGDLRRQPVHVVDVVPTVLDLAGVRPPQEHEGEPVPPLHGRSFVASLADAAAQPADDAIWWCHEGHRAVRVGDWKLVALRDKPWELYDLAADRCETKDRAGAEPARVAALEKEWNRIAEGCRRLAVSEATPAGKAAARVTRRPPNIVYVMTDDQGYGDIAAHGNPVIKTPNLDRLHRDSVRLTEFHASPTCAPTRAALLTGRHEFHSGVTHTIHERERLALSATTLPELLRTAGYATGIFGKWHLGDEDAYQPGRRGFHRTFIHGGGGIGQTFPGSCGDVAGNRYHDPVIRSDGTFVETKGYCTDVFFGEALRWIEASHHAGEPFFCMLTPNAPHDPLDCPVGSDVGYLKPLEAAGIADPVQRAKIARFYGMIENIDANVGRLLDTLDRLGIADDTLVVFTTDNGTATGAPVFNAGMRGAKGTVWRGGTRVPSFWRWPAALPSGVDVPAVTAHIDVLPTLCELAGAAIPPEIAPRVEGRSLVPLLRDPQAAWPDRPLVTHQGRWDRGQAAASQYRNCRIREGRWSLVNVTNKPHGWQLYDVVNDSAEAHDVASANPEIVARLAGTYDAWWAAVQDDLVNENIDGPAENPFKVAYRHQRRDAPALPQAGGAAVSTPKKGAKLKADPSAAFPPPTHADVAYGPHPKQVMHVWLADEATAERPAPLVFFIHGGGWQSGDRFSKLDQVLPSMLESGVSVVSVEYRFVKEATAEGVSPPVMGPLGDAARALQTVRHRAAEWRIDPSRIAACGSSAGACSSLWLAFHDDLADPTSGDPVARQSTRLLTAAVIGAQTTLDPAQMKAWIPNSTYGGHAFGIVKGVDGVDKPFEAFLAARDRLVPAIDNVSPVSLVSADDPPVYLVYAAPPSPRQTVKDPTHSAAFGVLLKERLDAVGVGCELAYPGSAAPHATVKDYLRDVLVPRD
jgi:arylsulfatase A-like enzyme/acetyl esterase/lipase